MARALDVVGDRWNLLIVRELLAGPRRFNELASGLVGVAKNLLTQRLRHLEGHGVIERRLGPSGVQYALTPWGAGLREPLEALGRWSAPLMMTGQGGDAFRPRWLVTALPALLRDVGPASAVPVGLEVDGALIVLHLDEHGIHAVFEPDLRPATVLTAPADVVVGLAAGALTVDQAVEAGSVLGDVDDLRRIFGNRANTIARPSGN